MDSASRSIQSFIKITKTVFDAGIQIFMEIDHIKSMNVPAGQYICSPPFNFAGGCWVLYYFPQGLSPANQGTNVAMYLVLLSKMRIRIQHLFKVKAKTANMDAVSATMLHTFSENKNCSGWHNFIPRDKLDTDYCINGCIEVCCNIRVFLEREFRFPGDLQAHIGNLWTRQEDFDVTFEVGGEQISAHKIILSARSPVFKAELFGNMAEAKLNYIRIEDMKAEVFKALVSFIYTDKLDSSIDDTMLEDLFVAADRYSLDTLKTLCEEQLAADLSIDKFVATLVLADRHNGVLLKKRCFEYALEPNNFVQLAFTGGYLRAMQDVPSLRDEFRENLLNQLNIPDQKRQRTE